MEGGSSTSAAGGSSNSSDFVRKLYKMLEDPSYKDVVRWNDSGDSFIVLETNQFTKNILPRHFKHSNFASFVRQLNKYDFHKVRNNDESGGAQYGEGAWEFQHPCFQINNKDQLDNIKRKAPAPKKPQPANDESGSHQMDDLNHRLHIIQDAQGEMHRKFEMLNNANQAALHEVMTLGRRMSQVENLLSEVVYHINNGRYPPGSVLESSGTFSRSQLPTVPEDDITSMTTGGNAVTPIQQAQQSQRSFLRMGNENNAPKHRPDQIAAVSQLPQEQEQQYQQPLATPTNVPIAYSTTGTENEQLYNIDPTSQVIDPSAMTGYNTTGGFSYSNLGSNELSTAFRNTNRPAFGSRRRSNAIAPNWVRKPKVLLVEDDTMCRRIGQKFLLAANCESDTASDGLAAVQKCDGVMPYDLILMDIMMPRLDGVSACEIIRKSFPNITSPPIISMTSNIRTDDVNKYFECGMIDILPKPFSKDGLLQKLQQHLPHLLKKQDSPPSDPTSGTYSSGNKQQGMKTGSDSNMQTQSQYSLDHETKQSMGIYGGNQGTATNEDDDGTGRSGETPDTSVGLSGIGSGGMSGTAGDDYGYMSGYPMDNSGQGSADLMTGFGGSAPNSRRPLQDVDDYTDRKRVRYGGRS